MTLTERLRRVQQLLHALTSAPVDVHLVCEPEGWLVLVSCPIGEVPSLLAELDGFAARRGGGWHGPLSKVGTDDESLYDAEQRVAGFIEAWIRRTWIPESPPYSDDAELLHDLLFTMGPLTTKHPEADK